MTTAQMVETSVTVNNNKSPIQDYVYPDDQTQPTFEMTLGFKPFTVRYLAIFLIIIIIIIIIIIMASCSRDGKQEQNKRFDSPGIWQASENESFNWLTETIAHLHFPVKVISKCKCAMLKTFIRLKLRAL